MTVRKSRSDKAAETRSRVVTQAGALFLAQGFAATSTRQIAAAAGVTERTLFNIVASKGELLRQVVLAEAFAGDQAPLLERADFAPVLVAPARQQFLAEFARWVINLHTRSAPLAEVVRAAATVQPEAAAVWAWGNARQVADCQRLAELLAERGWLREGPTASEIGVSLAVLTGHQTYWILVTGCGWLPQQYQRWLEHHCATELKG